MKSDIYHYELQLENPVVVVAETEYDQDMGEDKDTADKNIKSELIPEDKAPVDMVKIVEVLPEDKANVDMTKLVEALPDMHDIIKQAPVMFNKAADLYNKLNIQTNMQDMIQRAPAMYSKATAIYNQVKNNEIKLSPFIPVIASMTGVKVSTLETVSNLLSDFMGFQEL